MNLFYYLIEKEKNNEYYHKSKSEIHTLLKELDFETNFECAIQKENSYLHVVKNNSSYYISITIEESDLQEVIRIKAEDSTEVKQFFDYFIDDLNSYITKNRFEDFERNSKNKAKQKYENWKIEYEKEKETRTI